MTTQVASPPFQMDIRIAESPVVGMRFLLDGRATDLDVMAARLEAMVGDAVDQRAAVRGHLRRNEDLRRAMLADLGAQSPRGVEACFAEGLTLCAELGAVEERIAGLRLRVEGLRQEVGGLHHLSTCLASVGGGEMEVDVDATRYSRAVRQLHRWVDSDRDHIVQAIADGPLQHLDAAVVSAEVVAKRVAEEAPDPEASFEFERSLIAVTTARDELLDVVEQLRPPGVGGGLVAALRHLTEGLDVAAGRFVLVGEEQRLAAGVELALFRVAQQATANAVRHARAARIDVVLSLHRDRVILAVSDDGDGFDVVATEARLGKTQSCGLITMRHRSALGGGTFEVRSMVGGGTEVRVSFPRT